MSGRLSASPTSWLGIGIICRCEGKPSDDPDIAGPCLSFRAGRDGGPAQCLILYDKRDSGIQRFFIEQRYPNAGEVRGIYQLLREGVPPREVASRVFGLSEEKVNVTLTLLQDQRYVERAGQTVRLLTTKSAEELRLDFSFLEQRQQADYRRLGEMLDYLAAESCRRAAILRYFGERVPVGKSCGNCDLCRAARPSGRPIPGALDSRAVVLEAVRDLQKRGLGRSGLAQVLAGSQSRKIKQLKLDASPHYGKLARLTQDQIIEQIDGLISAGQLRLIPGQYPTVVLAPPAAKPGSGVTTTQAPAPVPSNLLQTPDARPQTLDPRLQTLDSGPQTPDSRPRTPDPRPQTPFDPLPAAVGWAILRVVQSQDGELARSGVVHFLRGTADIGARPASGRTALPGFRFLAQYAHQDLLRAVDLLIERKLLVVEATEHLHLWLTQRGKAALMTLKSEE